MKKEIKLSNGKLVIFDTETKDGYEDVLAFYESKLHTLVNNWKNIPHHDSEDLLQLCRIKLLDILENFDPNREVNFSTYFYTAMNRKMFQILAKYKSKKYSTYIENDNYINLNFPFDKKELAYLLKVHTDKCPIKRKVINGSMCKNCKYFIKYKNKDKVKNTLCRYYTDVLSQRGEKTSSLEQDFNSSDENFSLLNVLSCSKQKNNDINNEFNIDLETIKENLNPNTSEIVQLIVEGYNKTQIREKLNITSLEYERNIYFLSKNRKLKELLNKQNYQGE